MFGLDTLATTSIILATILVGFLAGGVGSYTGLGGGMIVRPMMSSVFELTGAASVIGSGTSKTISIISSSSVLFNSGVSTAKYAKSKNAVKLSGRLIVLLVVGTLLGNSAGTQVETVLVKLSENGNLYIDLAYAAFLGFVLLVLVYKDKIKELKWVNKSQLTYSISGITVGLLVGFISGLFGISGGAIKIPFILVVFRVSIKEAIRYALILALVASPIKLLTSSLYLGGIPIWGDAESLNTDALGLAWTLAPIIIPSTVIGSIYGVKLNSKSKDETVKKALVAVVGFFMIFGVVVASLKLTGIDVPL